MRLIYAILFCLCFVGSFFSLDSLKLVEPDTFVTEGEQLDYGNVGPGQTFSVQIYPILKDKEIFIGQWDKAYTLDLPKGWTSEQSPTYADPLIVKITSHRRAAEGEYVIPIVVEDEFDGEKIGGKFIFDIVVKVKHDILEIDVEPQSKTAGAGQPARFTITLTNRGFAQDVFIVEAKGVKGWEFERSVYISSDASKTFIYEVVGHEEESYDVTFEAVSKSSELIYVEERVHLDVRSNLLSDYKATSNGILLFPIIETPIYALAGILGFFFG